MENITALTVLHFRNFANFAKANTPEINQNALIAKVSTCEKNVKLSKSDKKGNY